LVEANGARVDEQRFPGRQGRILFAYLAAQNGRPVPRDELAEVLWGDALPATWEKALRVLMTKLRAVLEEGGIDGATALTSAFGCYQLTLPASAWIDVDAAKEALERAEAALAAGDLGEARSQATVAAALARRSFLPGEDSPWVEEKRRDLREVLVRSLECLRDACFGAGEFTEAVRHAQEVSEVEPFRESGYRRLMEAHAAAGNPAEALRVYERCRRFLAEELGAYPSPETEAVHRKLLQLDSGTGAHTAAERQPEQTPTETASHSTHLRLVQDKPAGDVANLRESGGWRRALPARLGRSGRRLAAAGLAVVVAATAALVAVRAADRGRTIAAIEANSLGLINLKSDRLVGQVPLGVRSGQVAVGEGAVWVANAEAGTVARVDPATRRVVQRIPVGREPAGVVAGGGAVWVANSGGRSVSWINPSTNTVVKTVPVGNGPTGIAMGDGTVWVANTLDNTVSRIDADTGKVVRTVPVGGTPSGVAVGLGAVWVSNTSDHTVSRISPSSNTVVRPISVGNGPRAIAVGAGGVWVANSLDGTVFRVDPASDAVVATVPVGAGPSAVAVGPGGVWAASEARGTVSRVDPETNTVVGTVQVGSAPAGAAAVDDGLWVTTRGAPTSHRGGTLRLTSSRAGFPRSIDPALLYNEDSQGQVLLMTNDGLVGYKRAGGVEGSELIANLATSLPRPTEGGTSYAFRLRPDMRYSTGQLVKPEDVRASMERGFKLRSSFARFFFSGLVGGEACVSRPATCDLSEGIVTDPAANTVTFHLSRPDPEFLVKLAQPYSFVVPADTPARGVGTSPAPATGPYMIQSFVPKQSLVLVRNPHFREWSRAAQPDGYPDRIEWTPSGQGDSPADENAAVDAVLAGQADFYGLHLEQPPGDRVEELTTRYASQAHLYPYTGQFAMYLNTRVPPFDDPRVRRALSYAVDRRAVQQRYPGPAQVTCQYWPPNFPGYQPYCPYTVDPSPAGAWTATDRAAATRLVKASGTRGMRVTVWSYSEFAGVSRYFVKLLDSLGYQARLKTIGPDFGKFWSFVNDSRNKAQMAAYWSQNAPSPADLALRLRCGSFVPNNGLNENTAQFCSRELEGKIERALRLQATDPTAAGPAWAAVDRQIVDQAPAIGLLVPQGIDLVSKRVDNYQHHPFLGVVLSQLWVV
jgi:YVTN family beta-propeller protein